MSSGWHVRRKRLPYWMAVVLVLLGSDYVRITAFNLSRDLKNCSECHRALGKDIEQLKRLQMIRLRIETALRAGRISSVGIQADGIPETQDELQPVETEEKEEIISFSKTIGKRDESSILEFVINTGTEKKELEVVSANLWVLVKKRGRNKKGKRIVLKVFDQRENGHSLLTYLRTKVRRSRWQKLSLPVSLIQTLVELPRGKLQLRVDCRRCGRIVKLVLPKNKRRRKRKKKPGPSPRGLRTEQALKKRPFLHIFTRVKSIPKSSQPKNRSSE